MHLRDALKSAGMTLRLLFDKTMEKYLLFPAFAVIVLSVIWWTTLNLIKIERTGAEETAAALSHELAETYEARAVRVLREIDQTLKLVKFAYEHNVERDVLKGLKGHALLPPDIVYVVSIANAQGHVVASTRPPATANIADQEYFQKQINSDLLVVSNPQKSSASEEWKLQFSRRLNAADGTFAGVVVVAVDAAFFVSGYEPYEFGEHGMLGMLGTDGIFRVKRTGNAVSVGDAVDYAEFAADVDQPNAAVATAVSVNSWDGVRRYMSVRRLFDFPLAVIVGLSEDEQFAEINRNKRVYLWRASAASVSLLLVVAMLWRMSWQLAQSRLRAIEDQVAYAKRIEHLAYHDCLTTLPNRSMFSTFLQQAINQARRHNKQLALLFLDLDRFKIINDTLGHEAGDQLLQEVASRLKSCLRDSDTVFRLGGDEFVVLLPELNEERYEAAVAQKILSSIAQPFILQCHECNVTASIGISTYPQDGLDEQTLTKNADIAMYQAKEKGKNNFQFYSEKQDANSLERLTLESDLIHALERHEFRLHYQARKDISSGRITGMEALLRWQHPGLGMLAPIKFIPISEEAGLSVPIGKWVLKTACLQNVAWQSQGLPRLRVATSLTVRQLFDANLLQDLAAILMETGMDACLLELKITESLLVRDVEKTLRVLTRLRDMGILIALTDFGAEHSSLSMLNKFQFDTIKIHHSPILDLTSDAKNSALTNAIIVMGKAIGRTVVAQGVETKEQADFLREHSCDEFNGYYFNQPVPPEQFAELLRAEANSAGIATRATNKS